MDKRPIVIKEIKDAVEDDRYIHYHDHSDNFKSSFMTVNMFQLFKQLS